MKDLPSVSAFPIEKKLNNAQERFYGSSEIPHASKPINVVAKINQIFSSNNHVYKSRVRITTKNDIMERMIIGKTSTELLTMSGDKVKIIDIVDIERI